jgi:hypothetical protein
VGSISKKGRLQEKQLTNKSVPWLKDGIRRPEYPDPLIPFKYWF